MISGALTIISVEGMPEVQAGDRLSEMIAAHTDVVDGDVIVITSKVVAKAEGRVVRLPNDNPEARVRLVESEAVRVLRRRGELLITETRHGFVCANAGIDWSNVEPGHAVLLPEAPDRSARKVRDGLRALTGADAGVVISDTFGRTWRSGVVDIAIGCAGITPVIDLRGTVDGNGNELRTTQICVADEIAAAAGLVMGKNRRVPAAIVRGADQSIFGEGSIRDDVVRRYHDDLFR